jgi:hypothetical protein
MILWKPDNYCFYKNDRPIQILLLQFHHHILFEFDNVSTDKNLNFGVHQ